MQAGCAVRVVTSPFAFLLLDGTALGIAGCQALLLPSLCLFDTSFSAWIVLASPTNCRYSMVGVAYIIVKACMGGPALLIATEL